MDENKIKLYDADKHLDVAEFVISFVQDNPFTVALGVVGVCIGVILDKKFKEMK